jgi:hypothetical protein
MSNDLIEVLIFLIVIYFLFYFGVLFSLFFIKKTDLVKKYKRASFVLAWSFFKLLVGFVYCVYYVATQDMQTSTRVLAVLGLIFTAFSLSALGWATLEMRRGAIELQSKEVAA